MIREASMIRRAWSNFRFRMIRDKTPGTRSNQTMDEYTKLTGWWVSCEKFTVVVYTDDELVITWAAPVVHKFVGQPLINLLRWFQRFNGLAVRRLSVGATDYP